MKTIPIILMTFIMLSCNQESSSPIIGGHCSYGEFSAEVYLSDYITDDNDSLMKVYFTKAGSKPGQNLWLIGDNIRRIGGGKINLKTVKDTSIRYRIKGEQIVEGSCAPYFIDEISIESK